jgi:hypothetical protein
MYLQMREILEGNITFSDFSREVSWKFSWSLRNNLLLHKATLEYNTPFSDSIQIFSKYFSNYVAYLNIELKSELGQYSD